MVDRDILARGGGASLTPCREPLCNNAEEAFRRQAVDSGWTVSKRGWPDFICERDGKIVIVEIKAHRRRILKREQRYVMNLLASYGVPCYRWSPDGGFERIGTRPFHVRERERAWTRP
jgi:hypothetical protein